MKRRKKVFLDILKNGERIPVEFEKVKKVLETVENNGDNVAVTLTSSKRGQNFKKVTIDCVALRKIARTADLILNNIIPKPLKNYLSDYTALIASAGVDNYEPIKGREEEIRKIWFNLSKMNDNNVILVGDVDVGKTTTAYEVIRQMVTLECPKKFYNRRAIILKLSDFFEIKSEVKKAYVFYQLEKFLEVHKKDIIIYIDDIIFMRMDEDLVHLFNKLVISEGIPVMMCARTEVYNELFLEDYFTKKHTNIVELEEPQYEELYPIIETRVTQIKEQYNVEIPDDIVDFAIYTSVLADTVSNNPGLTISILEQASTVANCEGKDVLDRECVLNCYDSYKKQYDAMSEEDKLITAYHEAGHFLTLKKSSITGRKTACVSILPMMDFLGVNFSYNILGKDIHQNREYMIDTIAIYLGGRVAEKMITNDLSTGASADLEVANTLAEEMLMKYGFSESASNRSYTMAGSFIKDYLLTDKEKEQINDEIVSIIGEARKRAEDILTENKLTLERIVNKLLEEDILTGDELDKIVANSAN